MASIKVGEIVEGVVTGIKDFGAFVLLPNGETGLVHISEVADSYVKDINEYLQKKDKVKVKVLSVNGDGKIGLSMKRVSSPSPNNGSERSVVQSSDRKRGHGRKGAATKPKASFEDKLTRFLKESDEKQQDLRRNTESKRRGGAVQDR